MTDTKKPVISARQMAVFLGIVIYLVVSNSEIFKGVPAMINIAFTLGTYILIMLLKKDQGIPELTDLFKSFINIIVSGGSVDDKMKKMEAVLVLVSQQLGALYEEELTKLMEYVRGVDDDGVITDEEVATIKEKIAALEAKVN